tara:strand:- start:14415 stop:15257 length:843 start_codon:yes stop_codon:yes gene_type:complete
MIKKTDICAVITTFQPNESLMANLLKINQQVGCIIVVDDTGTILSENIYINEIPNLIYINNERNRGIAFSLNSGVQKAIEAGFQWVLTLDDDTVIDDDYLKQISLFYAKTEIDRIGLVSCSREGQHINDVQIKRNLITSGCIFNTKVFLESGGFKEEMFIDLVDFDFCTRVRSSGYNLIQLPFIGMQHKVGNSKVKSILGLSIIVYHHLPFRLYYQVRNPFLFFKYNYKSDFLLSGYLLLNPVKILMKAILFEEQKLIRLKYIFKAFKDVILSKVGKLDE